MTPDLLMRCTGAAAVAAVKADPDAFTFIKHFESCRLYAYPDPKTGGAPWTCGWGDTAGVTPTTVWTQAEADARLATRIANTVEPQIRRAVAGLLTQGQFNALVSIIDNVGPGRADPAKRPGPDGRDGIVTLRSGSPSTLLRKLNARDYAGAADQFLKWNSPGSNVERGLTRRRTAERWLFLGHSVNEAIEAGEAAA